MTYIMLFLKGRSNYWIAQKSTFQKTKRNVFLFNRPGKKKPHLISFTEKELIKKSPRINTSS